MTDRRLPQSLEDIADIIGEAAALRLAVARGGTRVYVPHTPTHASVLVQIVGLQAAAELAARYAGERIDVPRAQRLRSKRARIARSRGSAAQVALEVGCTERWVREVRRDARREDDARQSDLFALLDE